MSLTRPEEVQRVCDFADLFPTPPVPTRWRCRMLALGSGDPTRAICSTLIAQCFALVRYPILPRIETLPSDEPNCAGCVHEILPVRHYRLFVPRDFDVSPYFQIIKPTLAAGFDYHALSWEESWWPSPDTPLYQFTSRSDVAPMRWIDRSAPSNSSS